MNNNLYKYMNDAYEAACYLNMFQFFFRNSGSVSSRSDTSASTSLFPS